jgi:protein phosphatase
MLCSDGLSSMVDDARILELVEENGSDVTAAARALVSEANANGGEDNITVILFQVASLDDTIEIPGAIVSAPPAAADEDTLDGVDAVPVVAAATTAPAPPPEKKRRRSWKIAAILVVILVAVAAGAGVYGLSRANFVGVNGNGYVAVYQGVPWNLPFGIHLYREVYTSHLLAAELSRVDRKKLFDHTLRDRAASERQIARYGRFVVGSQ